MLNIDELLPTAKDIRKQSALKEAEKADEHMRLMAAAEELRHRTSVRHRQRLECFEIDDVHLQC